MKVIKQILQKTCEDEVMSDTQDYQQYREFGQSLKNTQNNPRRNCGGNIETTSPPEETIH